MGRVLAPVIAPASSALLNSARAPNNVAGAGANQDSFVRLLVRVDLS
jgi:hypothetical protein